MASLAFGFQVGVDHLWASQRRAEIGGRTCCVRAIVAHPEPDIKALQQVRGEVTSGVT